MKKLGIYGGTFNPIHNGHIKAAENFYDEIGLDELLIMPTFISPHKEMGKGDDPSYRLEMAELAFEKNERNIVVSDYEIERGGKSYTYLTLEHFKCPEVELFFLVGTDMFLCLDRWKNPQNIFDAATIVLMRREDEHDVSEALNEKKKIYENKFGAKIVFLKSDPIELSSSFVRGVASSGDDVSESVGESVAKYISSYRLYTSDPIYNAVRELVPKKRHRHIFGTVDEALRLAEIFCLSFKEVEDLRVAAALHDITKYFSRDEHVRYLEGKGISIDSETLKSHKTYHQLSGAVRARELFPDAVNDTVFNAIRYHTTAKADMSITEKIMYLSDYIEPNRTFPDCVKLREYFYTKINNGENKDDVLCDTLILSLEMTINDLKSEGYPIHKDTSEALEFLKGEKKNGRK